MKTRALFLPAAAILLGLACGGGSSSSPKVATAMDYTNPSGSGQWQLVKDAASTGTHLVLDLLAPAGTSGQGVTLVLSTDTGHAKWSFASGSAYVGALAYVSPNVNVATVSGGDLRVVVAQAPGTPVSYGSAPVLTVALDLVGGVPPAAVTLSASQAGHLGASLPAVPITVAVGTLQAN